MLDVLMIPMNALVCTQVFSAASSMRTRRMPLAAQSFAASAQRERTDAERVVVPAERRRRTRLAAQATSPTRARPRPHPRRAAPPAGAARAARPRRRPATRRHRAPPAARAAAPLPPRAAPPAPARPAGAARAPARRRRRPRPRSAPPAPPAPPPPPPAPAPPPPPADRRCAAPEAPPTPPPPLPPDALAPPPPLAQWRRRDPGPGHRRRCRPRRRRPTLTPAHTRSARTRRRGRRSAALPEARAHHRKLHRQNTTKWGVSNPALDALCTGWNRLARLGELADRRPPRLSLRSCGLFFCWSRGSPARWPDRVAPSPRRAEP